MQGDRAVVDLLNLLLGEELAATHQSMLHARILHHQGHAKLGALIKKQAIDEMHHAQSLIDRLLFLDARPNMQLAAEMKVGDTPQSMLEAQLDLEVKGITSYREGIALTRHQQDYVTARLLEDLLKEEEEHHDWLETQLDLIKQLGFANYAASLTAALETGE